MKKIFTFFTALLLFGSMTVAKADYFVAGTMNEWTTNSNDWKMSLVSGTIYSKTAFAMSAGGYEFKITNGTWSSSWGGGQKDNTQSNVTLSGSDNISFTLSTTSDVTFYFDAGSTKKIYVQATPVVVPSYTFPSGTKIYYDFTAYGSGINVYAPGNSQEASGGWYASTAEVIEVTLSSDWEITASTALFKSAPPSGTWPTKTCSTLPEDGQNMLVGDANGIDCHWGTYVPPTNPTVAFVSLGTTIGAGMTVKFAATSTNVENPVYTFYVKKGEGEYGSAVPSFTFDEEGAYTVKVAVDGDDSKHTEAIQDVTVVNGNIVYYVKTNDWDQINAYMWNGGGDDASWPGKVMSLTSATTAKHNYPVYALVFTGDYPNIIFSNNGNNQTTDLDLDLSKPYFYNNEWFASLDNCDPTEGVDFDGLDATILKGSVVNFAAQTVGIEDPVVTFFVRPQDGSYGSAVTSYTFNELGKFVVKVEATGTGLVQPVFREKVVEVYTTYTFTSGTTIRVDFSAVEDETKKGVNYPYADAASLAHDANGAGTVKVITFTQDVEWSTLDNFIKTEKAGWAGLKFSVPAAGKDLVVVASDGASYEWSTFVPSTYFLKNNWNGGDWTWQEMTAVGDGTFRLENVVYGGHGINYNYEADDAGAVWKDYTKIKYMDGETAKLVEAFDVINLVLDPAHDTIWAKMAQKNNPVYTVASNSLALCDLGWAPTHPYKYTDMKKQTDGTYMWNHEDAKVILPAGEVKLKIVKDRSYDNGSWPASDFVYNIQRSGEYEITVHFNPWTKEITIDTTCVKPLNIQVPLYIKGSWNNWSATPMLLGGYNDKAIVTLSFAETGTYNFKLEDVKEKWYGDGQAFTRNNSSHKDIEAKDESATEAMTLQVDKAGDYLVTYFYDGEILLVQYPAIVPAEKIAPLSGKFTINAKGDTAVFSRGNLHYNYESDAWYAAENQYDALGDLNLRFGDATYTGSIDLFGWSSENSDFGKQWKYRDEEFAGDFVDWGTLFAGDEKEWSTLSKAEWLYLLGREDASKNKLWTILEIGPDSLSGLVLFPDNWEDPAGLTIKYGFYDLEKEEDLRANAFSYAQWESMEAAGAVFLPLAGQRAGFYGNNWTGSAETDQSNPLSNGYNWVDEANGMTYYWTSTPDGEIRAYCFSVPGFNATSWLAPMPLNRERRRGHPVRLVTRIPKVEWTTVREGLTAGNYYTLCNAKEMTAIKGGTLWSFAGKDEQLAYIIQEDAPFEAGKPYLIYAESDKLEAVLAGDDAPASDNNGLFGTLSFMSTADLNGSGATHLLKNNELRPVGAGTLRAGRAYIKAGELPDGKPSNAPAHKVRSMPMQRDAAQGFEEVQGDKVQSTKLLMDGHLYILRGENVYDVTGRLVK